MSQNLLAFIIAFTLHFGIGFFFSAYMARHYEQDGDDYVWMNFALWEIAIPVCFIIFLWRSLAGTNQNTWKEDHYKWSRWLD